MMAWLLRSRTPHFAAMMALTLAPFLLPATAAADAVKVRAAAQKNFGRVLFIWPSPVKYTAEKSGNRVVVKFTRPVDANFAPVTKVLGGYVSKVAKGKDGRTVSLTLKGDYDLRHFNMGGSVILDLVGKKPDAGGQVAAPEAPKKPSKKVTAKAPAPVSKKAEKPKKPKSKRMTRKSPAGAPLVSVKAGVHKGYSRLVFEWPAAVGYQVEQTGGEATIKFDKPARVALGKLKSGKTKFVRGASSDYDGKGTAVTLDIDPASKIRHFKSESLVVVDVVAPGKKEEPKQEAKAQAVQKPVQTAAEKAGQEAAAAAMKAAPMPKPKAPAGPPRALNPEVVKQEQKEGDKKSAKVLAAEKSLKGLEGIKISAAPKGGGGTGIIMKFDWNEPVGAAVFRRAGYLWVVFDKPSKQDIVALSTAGGNIVRNIEQIPSKQATIIRMTTVAGVNPLPRRLGLTWRLDFRQKPLEPKTPIESTPQPNSPVGARLFLPVPEPGNAIGVKDPEVGDNLIVVPVIPLGYGVAQAYGYPQLRILPAIQGAVIQPMSDDLRVRPLRQGIEVTSASGLKISSVSPDLAASAKGGMRALTRYFKPKEWKAAEIDKFNAEKHRFMAAVAKSKGRNREKAQLNLARFYFANGFNAETLGVLRVAADARKRLVNTPNFRGLRGASSFFMDRLSDAREDLGYESLKNFDEGEFWRAAVQARSGDLSGAARTLLKRAQIVSPYPKELKIPLTLLLAEAAIEVGDVTKATEFLSDLKAENPNPAQTSQIDFVEGRLLELAGDFDSAVGLWEQVEEGPHRPSRGKASVARAELLLKLKKIKLPEAIEEFEKLRFSWRGDEFEFNLLRRLGRLYIDDGNYRNGLRTLRQAATHFRTNPKATEVTQEMVDAYDRLYMQGEADRLAPITAIALYDEFRELTPPGEKGDAMIRKLADRLVGVDLLDRGAALLEAQIKFRLKGEEKAKVGAQLANIYVLAREYDKAIQALNDTEEIGVTEEIAANRRRLRARTLTLNNEDDAALLLLKGDKSIEADKLRTEIFWKQKEWPLVSQAFRNLLRASGAKPKEPLDDRQGQYVLNLAIALTLSGNERSLNRLRVDFGQSMEKSPYRDAFRLIASPQTKGLIDYKTIADKLDDIENFRSFLTAYQNRQG